MERGSGRLYSIRRLDRLGRRQPNDGDRRLSAHRWLVYRYRTEEAVDGLAGEEGTFLLCTFWLAQALALADQVDRARAVFERAAAFANDLGLLAEEVSPDTGELLGNFPQAFSHIGLVNAAWAISEAERRTRSRSCTWRACLL
jgi:alpha,alpha-trehalase